MRFMNIPTDFNEMTVLQMRERLDSGEMTSIELVEFYFNRIEVLDKTGPQLNSVLELNPDVLDIAKEMDEELNSNKTRSLLHGIPVLIKGNIDTADKMESNAGSVALSGHFAENDAQIVKYLREAGAVILGKANLSKWANFRSSRSSSGWSSLGGQTKNPYDETRSPCGSSSGSAVAVSANLCAVAVGTETDGSIVCPSHMNGIVGIKPTVGLVSQQGIIPISHSQDTAGPMARTVTDAAILLDILSGTKIYSADFLQNLNKDSLNGMRIGVARDYLGFHEEVDKIMEQSIELLKKNGAVIIDPVHIETKDKYNDEEFEVLLYEFKEGLNNYLSTTDGKVQSLKELIDYNKDNAERIMPYFKQEILEEAETKGSLSESEYINALKKCRELSREKGIDKTLKDNKLDLLIAPTGGPAWKIDLINGDHYGGGSSQSAAVSGYPNITIPAGFVHGLPVGISFMGPANSEKRLISLAYAFEQYSKVRKEPELII